MKKRFSILIEVEGLGAGVPQIFLDHMTGWIGPDGYRVIGFQEEPFDPFSIPWNPKTPAPTYPTPTMPYPPFDWTAAYRGGEGSA